MLRSDGYSDFAALLEQRVAREATLIAFDLLQIDREDLRPFPLAERKSRLEQLLEQQRAGVMILLEPPVQMLNSPREKDICIGVKSA